VDERTLKTQAEVLAETFAASRHPLPLWDGLQPLVSNEFRAADGDDGRRHLGADLMYKRPVPGKRKLPVYTPTYFMPGEPDDDEVPVFSPFDGKVWSITYSKSGMMLLKIDHGNVPGIGPLLTMFLHGRKPVVKPGWRLRAGDPTHTVGKSGTDTNHSHAEFLLTARPRRYPAPRRADGYAEPSTDLHWPTDPAPFLARMPRMDLDGNVHAPPAGPLPALPGPAHLPSGGLAWAAVAAITAKTAHLI